jgi:hypothetical protein
MLLAWPVAAAIEKYLLSSFLGGDLPWLRWITAGVVSALVLIVLGLKVAGQHATERFKRVLCFAVLAMGLVCLIGVFGPDPMRALLTGIANIFVAITSWRVPVVAMKEAATS